MIRPLTSLVLVTAFLAASTVAQAKIVCRDGFQRSGGQDIATPYCGDEHLAELARQHGVKVSGAAVRGNPAVKYEICRMIGHTAQASDYCPPDSGGRDGGR